MIVIGLTGSIAMGKSEVAAVFDSQNIPVFDADKTVHAIYDSEVGTNLLCPLVPKAIVNNKVDRGILSREVLGDKHLLEKLEAIIHQAVAQERENFLRTKKVEGHEIVVLDIPLLFEKKGEKHVDVTVVVSAPLDQQRTRALQRPGMTEDKLDMILSRQMPDHEKRRRADYVIVNDSSLALLRSRTMQVLSKIKKEHGQ